MNTAVELSGGCSYIRSCNTLATGLSGGGICTLRIPGWIFNRQATTIAVALFGPWLDSSVCPVEVVFILISPSVAGGGDLQRDNVMIVILSTTSEVKVILVIKYSFWGSWAVERPRGWPTVASGWHDGNGNEANYRNF
jgi:hypothetical protein